MVAKFVTTSLQGDLFNAADFFGAGNDTLFLMIPTPMETAIRTYQGNDSVIVTIPPAAGSTGYRFYLGTGNDTLQGSSVHDEYYDEGGDDQVNMGAGSDEVYAGPGNDTIDAGSDNSSSGPGVWGDTINFGFAYDMFGNRTPVTQGVTLNLASTSPQALGFYGNDTFLNFESVIGGVGNDHFSGTNAANYMDGSVGTDFLRGLGGDDKLLGGPGKDLLIGDGGADHLDVGQSIGQSVGEFDGEADVVKYVRISDSTFESMDEIFNFQNLAAGGIDKIDLSAIDANPSLAGNQAFKFVGSAGFSLPGGEVRLGQFDGATLVMVDNDGDSTAEMLILIHGATGLTANDFIL